MCHRRPPRIVPISHYYIYIRGESGLFFATPGLSYYVIILRGSSCTGRRVKFRREKEGRKVAGASHAASSSSSSDPSSPQGRTSMDL